MSGDAEAASLIMRNAPSLGSDIEDHRRTIPAAHSLVNPERAPISARPRPGDAGARLAGAGDLA
jgi:hypothetical protein